MAHMSNVEVGPISLTQRRQSLLEQKRLTELELQAWHRLAIDFCEKLIDSETELVSVRLENTELKAELEKLKGEGKWRIKWQRR